MPAECIELIPGSLVWAPEQHPAQAHGRQTVDALDLCRHGATAWSKAGTYEVRHYSQAARGHAFGPLGMESLLRFCRGLAAKLEGLQPGGGALALVTLPSNKEHRANAAVLLGAYLVLRHGWSAASLAAGFGKKDGGAKFACSWGKKASSASERVMQVRDCWAGVELAKLQGWIDASVLEDDARLAKACTEYDRQLTFSDTAWLIPGMLMVGADPTTVVFDSNPATCSRLFPDGGKGGSSTTMDPSPRSCDSISLEPAYKEFDTGAIHDLTSPKSCNSIRLSGNHSGRSLASVSKEYDMDPIDVLPSPKSCNSIRLPSKHSSRSLASICKEYDKDPIDDSTKQEDASTGKEQAGLDFTSFLRQSGIGIIVRTNFDDESGLPGRKSYGDHAFEAYGLGQANVRVVDERGAVPLPSDVARMLEACEGFMEQRGEAAVLVHCKGGFGRSVVLACCLAISRLDVPGSDLLGWSRIVRPGAVNTREQELFLASLKGRRDVLRYAKIPIVDDHKGGVSLSCGNPCYIQ